jgi:hypothetical protein
VDTGFVDTTHYGEVELPEDWDDMEEEERQQYINECCEEAIGNYIEAYGEVIDE